MITLTDITATVKGSYAEEINDYSGSSCICDVIQEIADRNTSIYYSDIKEFISSHIDAFEDALDEFGWEGCGSDFYKAGQMAEFLYIENEIYSVLEDAIKAYAANYIRTTYNTEEIKPETWEMISAELSDIDNNNMLCDIDEICVRWMNEIEVEQAESDIA